MRFVLGERESGAATLRQAVAAYREALKELTRARVPLDWAMTQNNLGNVLYVLGERESGTATSQEAATAFRVALEEYTPEAATYQHDLVQRNLDRLIALIAQRGNKRQSKKS